MERQSARLKKVILIVIDSLAARYVLPALETGRLPNMRALYHAGTARTACTIFPSITHACLSTIATGVYPKDHGVFGAFYMDQEAGELSYYGSDIWVILSQGVEAFLHGFLYRLNHERLKAPTVFERIEEAGKSAGVINHLIFRGLHPHRLSPTGLLAALPGVSSVEQLMGPSTFYLGDFVGGSQGEDDPDTRAPGGVMRRFGISDEGTMHVLLQLARNDALPDFTLAYFPDNDLECHSGGPDCTFNVLDELDRGLGELLTCMGGVTAALEKTTFLIVGDHAQTPIVDDPAVAGIALEEVLSGFSIIGAGQVLDETRELMAAPNLRSCAFYGHSPDLDFFDRLSGMLLSDERVDQVLWRAEAAIPGEPGFRVVTADRGALHFWPAERDGACGYDLYGQPWGWNGDLRALDMTVEGDRLMYGQYPNAMERIAGCLSSPSSGHAWATAKPGHEFQLPRMSVHAGGGSHGSLHELDSLVPLIAAGLPDDVELPEAPRLIDVTPLVLRCLSVA